MFREVGNGNQQETKKQAAASCLTGSAEPGKQSHEAACKKQWAYELGTSLTEATCETIDITFQQRNQQRVIRMEDLIVGVLKKACWNVSCQPYGLTLKAPVRHRIVGFHRSK